MNDVPNRVLALICFFGTSTVNSASLFPATDFTSVRVSVAKVLESNCRLVYELWDCLRDNKFAQSWKDCDLQRLPGQVIALTKPRVVRGFSAPNELHAAGEFALFLLNSMGTTLRMIDKGAPIGIVPIKKTVGSSWGISIPKTVPHPNAAKLFVNYLLSSEGLLKYADANFTPI